MADKIINKAVIRKWGNSQGIRIPKDYMERLQVNINEPVEICIENDAITIRKCRKFNNLQERLEAFYGKPIDDIFIENTQEIDWDVPESEEI